MSNTIVIPLESVGQRIFIIRGVKVMLDSDIAALYKIPTKRLNEQVKRNLDRFPPDFMFQLSQNELKNLRSQFATSSEHGGIRYTPYVFTEHGVAMLAAVLRSSRATQMSVFIVRAFIKLRELLASNKELGHRVELLEKEQHKHGEDISEINNKIRELTSRPMSPKERIGFRRK